MNEKLTIEMDAEKVTFLRCIERLVHLKRELKDQGLSKFAAGVEFAIDELKAEMTK